MRDSKDTAAGATELVDLVGNTPLIPLRNLTRHLPANVRVLLKAEWFNPGGSVKDRAALRIVKDAMAKGQLAAGGTLLDSSSGNTGIAYAMLGAALGFRVMLCVPKNANRERKKTLLAYGAHLVLTNPAEGSDGAIVEARRLKAEDPKLFYADQYSNDSNWRAHYDSTGPEIVRQTGGDLTHLVVGLGTSGTFVGTGRYLRDHAPRCRIIAFQPDSPFHGLEGMKHMASAIVPKIYDPSVAHEQRGARTENAHAMARRLGKEEGLLVGISAGAAAHMALEVAAEEAEAGRAATIVCIAPDGGNRYLSEAFWEEGS